MKATFILSLGLAALALAGPVPEAQPEAEAGLVDSITAALPHPIAGSDKRDLAAGFAEALDTKIVTDGKPVDLVTRQAKGKKGKAKKAKKAAKKGKGKKANVVTRAPQAKGKGKGKKGKAKKAKGKAA